MSYKKIVIMSILALALFAFSAKAADAVNYLDWDPAQKKMVEKTCTDYTVVTVDTATFADGEWYVVNSQVSRDAITVNGAAHLILCDGAGLSLQGGVSGAGLSVSDGNSITIYGQRRDTGTLQARGGAYGAGIGGGAKGAGGTVTINGGTVTAKGAKFGAGIGGGSSGAGGTVTINGGTVTATSGLDGAGIGGGDQGAGGTVTVNGGTVAASSGRYGAGIGGSSVVICGGSVGASIPNAQNASGAALWRVTVEELGESVPTFEELPSGYGTAGITPVDGEVWLWWPNGTYFFTVNDEMYLATVNNANTVATKVPSWTIGTGVKAAWVDGLLTILGKGTIDDFASAADVPWQGLSVTNMTIASGVKPGRNLLAGLADTTTVNGAAVSLIRQLSGDFLVGEVAPAEATALEIDGGQVRLTVEVDASTDLKNWKPAKTFEIAVPVEGEKGFYILKSK